MEEKRRVLESQADCTNKRLEEEIARRKVAEEELGWLLQKGIVRVVDKAMLAGIKSFMEPDFASYLRLGELDIWGLRQMCDDLDSEEGHLEGSASHVGPSSTPQGVTVAKPSFVLNFTIPCIVDDMACSRKRAGRPRIISSSDLCLTTKNSIILVTLSFPSWLSNVNGRFMVLSGHSLCPVKPTSGARVGGLRLLFQDDRSRSRQYSYRMSVLLPPSARTHQI
ncbi:unnamed protein product [Lactuca saligna]|uniref:Uncharacterized protein n=1 Tax=Lactuca saligna TaxID=75948 RepID=A0AA36E250_LACSI|nr:unnamed protein product [Lactuca saligna]